MGAKKRRVDVAVEMGRLKHDATQHSTSASSFWHSPDDPYFLPSEGDEDMDVLPEIPLKAADQLDASIRQGAKVLPTRTSPRQRSRLGQSCLQKTSAHESQRSSQVLPSRSPPSTIIPESPEPVTKSLRPAGPKSQAIFQTWRADTVGADNCAAAHKPVMNSTKSLKMSKPSSQPSHFDTDAPTAAVDTEALPISNAPHAPAEEVTGGDNKEMPVIQQNGKEKLVLRAIDRPLKQSRLGFSRKALDAKASEAQSSQIQRAPESQASHKAAASTSSQAPVATCSPAMSQALDEVEASLPTVGRDSRPSRKGAAGRPGGQAKPAQRAMSRLNPAAAPELISSIQHSAKQSSLVPLEGGRALEVDDRHADKGAVDRIAGVLTHKDQQQEPVPSGLKGATTNNEATRRDVQQETVCHSISGGGVRPLPAKKQTVDRVLNNGPTRSKPRAANSKSGATVQAGLRTPLLLRHGFHNSLSRALSGISFHTPAPAITVNEAQESGEQRLVQDNMMYALDGLCSSSSSVTHCKAAGSLLDIAVSKRGRQAMRCDGVLSEALATAKAILSKEWHPGLAAIFAAIVHLFLADAANVSALACKGGIDLIISLISGGQGAMKESEPLHPVVARLVTALESSKTLPSGRSQQTLAADICLLSLVGAVDAQQASPASESLKTSIRELGALLEVAQMVASLSKRDPETWDLFTLRMSLLCLENCTFACPASESFLVKLRIQDGSTAHSFVSKLVRVAQQLAEKRTISEGCMNCLHSALSVAMNLTHHNDMGCQQVVNAGGAQLCTDLLAGMSSKQDSRCEGDSAVQQLEMVTVAMGLLINIAENCVQSLHALTRESSAGGVDLMGLVCRLFDEYSSNQAENEEEDRSGLADELTAEDLSRQENTGARSVIEVYTALLIGFLAVSTSSLWKEAEANLAGHSLRPVEAKVQQCLKFYLAAGAITQKTEDSLKHLVATMAVSLK